MTRDIQPVTGKNLLYIQEATGQPGEEAGVSPQYRWRLPSLCSLLRQRREAYQLALEDEESRLTKLIDSLVAN